MPLVYLSRDRLEYAVLPLWRTPKIDYPHGRGLSGHGSPLISRYDGGSRKTRSAICFCAQSGTRSDRHASHETIES